MTTLSLDLKKTMECSLRRHCKLGTNHARFKNDNVFQLCVFIWRLHMLVCMHLIGIHTCYCILDIDEETVNSGDIWGTLLAGTHFSFFVIFHDERELFNILGRFSLSWVILLP